MRKNSVRNYRKDNETMQRDKLWAKPSSDDKMRCQTNRKISHEPYDAKNIEEDDPGSKGMETGQRGDCLRDMCTKEEVKLLLLRTCSGVVDTLVSSRWHFFRAEYAKWLFNAPCSWSCDTEDDVQDVDVRVRRSSRRSSRAWVSLLRSRKFLLVWVSKHRC